ncbi:MAG: DUF3473 domain-containing protein [Nitrospirae bacterium]|nr:MAG: DUF3473 domain-containing protein [Nitrospirota bacterium]
MIPVGHFQERPWHCLSFDIEEHFQVAAFDSPARRRQWEVLDSRVERNTERILDLLEEHGLKATMFILGWVGERHPRLLRRIVEAGHEIASHGYAHELITAQTGAQFREDIRRAKAVLEDATGVPVLGYRAPTFSITRETMWALPILVEEGYRYDSSIFPVVHDHYGIPGANPSPHLLSTSSGALWEVPPSTCKVGWMRVPVAGGGYFRIFPYWLFRRLLKRVEADREVLVMYFHPWEFDADQPRMAGPLLSRFRHYCNLKKTQGRFLQLLRDFRFGPIREVLPVIARLYTAASPDEQTNVFCLSSAGSS